MPSNDFTSIECKELFSLEHTIAKKLFQESIYPFEVLSKIKDFIIEVSKNLHKDKYNKVGDYMYIAKSAIVHSSAVLNGPFIIGENTEVRPSAFIRGSLICGDNCVIGNSTELKNVILFDNVQVPHYNYVGDSILGYKAHMGAGSITSNVKGDKSLVVLKNNNAFLETGLKKFGAILGDYAEIGCNSVLNPGTIIGKNTQIYPLSSVRGIIPSNSRYKSENNISKQHNII